MRGGVVAGLEISQRDYPVDPHILLILHQPHPPPASLSHPPPPIAVPITPSLLLCILHKKKIGAGLDGANSALHGTRHLDKPFGHLLDSDAIPDKCTNLIWV
jgi:hypothetical protein